MASRDKVWIDELGVYVTIPTAELGVPTIDPITGALVDPSTGEIVLGTMAITAPRVSPLCFGSRRADYTADAALNAATGAIGVLDSTPTAAEALAAQINIEFSADELVWGLEINMPDTAGTLVDGLRVAIQPGDYVSASQILISAASAQRIDIAHNTSTIYEFRDADNNRAYVTALSMVWTPRAGGSGYPTKPLSIRGLANVYKTQALRGLTPESVKRATLAARGESMLYAMHSVQSETAVSISAVSLTNPCVLTLASSVSLYPGQKVRIAGVNATVNGNRSVITAYASTVVLDLDATAAAAYTSGGTLVCDVTWDRMGVGQTQQIQGTKTGMWGNPTLGITGNATGLYAFGMTTGLGLLDLQDTNKGILILAVRCAFAANPTSVEEVMFCAGVSGQSAAGSAQGFIQLRCTTSGLLGLQYRRAAASDGGAANSSKNYSTEAITANTEHTFTVAIDPVSGQYLLIKDDLVSDYLTNYLPVDGNNHAKPLAYAIGCNMDANNGISGTRLWGKGSSTPKMQYLHIVRNPRLVLSDALTFARDFHQSPADIPSVLLK